MVKVSLMSGSCHFTGCKCQNWCWSQIFVTVIFFTCDWVLQFRAHSRYYKGALTQKRSFLVLCTTFRSDFHVCWNNQNKHSTVNLSFNALSYDIKLNIDLEENNKQMYCKIPNFCCCNSRKKEDTAGPLLFSNCNNNKNQNKEIWFSYWLMQWNQHWSFFKG